MIHQQPGFIAQQIVRLFQADLRHSECWTPLLFENVQAYTAVAVDVWVIDFGLEVDLHGMSTMPVAISMSTQLQSNSMLGMQHTFGGLKG